MSGATIGWETILVHHTGVSDKNGTARGPREIGSVRCGSAVSARGELFSLRRG